MSVNNLSFKAVLTGGISPVKHLARLTTFPFLRLSRTEKRLGLTVIQGITAYFARHNLPSVRALVGTLETKPLN